MPEVVYELSLRDRMSAPLEAISHQAEKLHHHFEGLGRMLEGFGISFLAFKGIEFVKDSIQEVHVLNQSMAQVKAGLISTGEAAGVSFEKINESAEKFAHTLPYTKGQIMDMQSQLITFPKIAGETFDKATQTVLDMSSRTHRGLNEVSIMVGKALQDPEKGISALRRVGVNFNETQTEAIQKMVEVGHVAQAQKAILQELNSEYGGSAQASADADPLFRYNKAMEELKETVGEVATEFLHDLTPSLESFAQGLKDSFHWLKENWTTIKAVSEGLAAAWIAYKTLSGATIIWAAITTATGGATTAVALFDAAMASTAVTVGSLVVVIGSLVTLYKLLEEQSSRTNDAMNHINQDNIAYEKGKYEDHVKHYQTGKGVTEEMAKSQAMKDLKNDKENYTHTLVQLNQEMEMIREQQKNAPNMQLRREFEEKAFKIGVQIGSYKSLLKGADESIAEHSLLPKKGKTTGTPVIEKEKTKATGSKSVTINVHIKDLIGTQNINTTNLKEGAAKIHDIVTEALASATNDFQVIAAR